jgi:hypothetical protein
VSVPEPASFPALALPDLEGRPRRLDEAWSGGLALILVGHADCRTTRDALPYLERIHRRRGAGSSVVLVLQDDRATAHAIVADQDLSVPVRLEPDPYPLARALQLIAVPTFYLVDALGRIERVSIGLSRSELEGFASSLGVAGPVFTPEDRAPEFRPG